MSYNARSPAVKRLMKEAQELAEPTELYYAQPLEDNLFEWHFTIRGPEDTDFQGGIYHGRILLPSEYPMKPPNILLLTPNGRFEIKRKICLSISGYHPESWRPCWSIRTALLAIIGFMPTHGGGAIGSLDFSSEERKKLAKASSEFVCSECGPTISILLPQTEASSKDIEEAKTLAKQIDFQSEKQKSVAQAQTSTATASATTPNTTAASPTVTPAPQFLTSPPPIVPVQISAGVSPMPAGFLPPWNFYNYFPGMMMPQIPCQNQPLTFEQWIVQVKGYQTPSPATVPTSSPEESKPTEKTEERKDDHKTENKNESEQVDETEKDSSVEETPEEKPEEEKEAAIVESTPVVEHQPTHLDENIEEVEEWPMFSLFVICFLLIVVLLINRYCLPFVYSAFRSDEL